MNEETFYCGECGCECEVVDRFKNEENAANGFADYVSDCCYAPVYQDARLKKACKQEDLADLFSEPEPEKISVDMNYIDYLLIEMM